MNGLTIFGFVSIMAMLIAYSMEYRHSIWILVFAFACASSSVYAWMADTLPFAIVEAIWSVIALRRWSQARRITG